MACKKFADKNDTNVIIAILINTDMFIFTASIKTLGYLGAINN